LIALLTDSDIIENGKNAKHPLLHELCDHLCDQNLSLFLVFWQSPQFLKYWDNMNYIDMYENSALQRLSVYLSRGDKQVNNWIKEKVGVIPSSKTIEGKCVGRYRIQWPV